MIPKEPGPEFWTALLSAQRDARGAPKDGDGQRGSYTTCETMIQVAKAAMHAHDLVLTVERARIDEDAGEDIDTKTGAIRASVSRTLARSFALVHAPTGQGLSITWEDPIVSGRGRPIDHATAAASSFGLTYLLRDILQIPRGENAGMAAELAPELKSDPTPTKRIERRPRQEPPPHMERQPAGIHKRPAPDRQTTPRRRDHTAADIRDAGWPTDAILSAEELEAFEDGALCDEAKRDLHRAIVQLTDASTAREVWTLAGVTIVKGAEITGTQARTAAMIALEVRERKQK